MTLATPEDLAAIRRQAEHRRGYILFLAARLREPADNPDIRRAAAAELEALIATAKEST